MTDGYGIPLGRVLAGAVRGKKVITTMPDPAAARAPDLLDREFVAPAPNRTWVADFTHVAAWTGVVYVAFIVDTFSRRIVGWSASLSKQTQLVLDALDMGLWQRDRDGRPPIPGELVHHCDAGSQDTSFRLAEHLDSARIGASIGSVGDAYDNALMESTIGLFKTEVIKPQLPWKTCHTSNSPLPSGSTGTTTADSSVRSGTSHRQIRSQLLPSNHESPGHSQHLRSLSNPEGCAGTATDRCSGSWHRAS